MDDGHVCRGSIQRLRWQGSKTMISSALFAVILFQAQSPTAAQPIDLTGYWVSVVTQDWRWRMVTPAKGDSVAEWERARATPKSGSLKVVTTHLRPGYLRKNGVPYSAKAVLTEYWDLATERNQEQWITITSVVDDPQYLRQPWVTALHFKKEPDREKWDPSACSSR